MRLFNTDAQVVQMPFQGEYIPFSARMPSLVAGQLMAPCYISAVIGKRASCRTCL